jgi:hypothetical protein
LPTPTTSTTASVPAATTVAGTNPVDTAPLADISPEALGLLTVNDGGLGAAMWQGTPHALVERLLPALALPTTSAPLNRLAQRWLLSTAAPPDATPKSG